MCCTFVHTNVDMLIYIFLYKYFYLFTVLSGFVSQIRLPDIDTDEVGTLFSDRRVRLKQKTNRELCVDECLGKYQLTQHLSIDPLVCYGHLNTK